LRVCRMKAISLERSNLRTWGAAMLRPYAEVLARAGGRQRKGR
jgi:hypothetical protein